MSEEAPRLPSDHDHVAEPRTKYAGFRMTDDYRRWIEEIEALPQNQSGSDKTWVAELLRRTAEHFARAKRVR